MLNGHLDTIPNQNNQPRFREGDLLFGRGTTDMKSGMAAMLGAAKAILETGMKLRGDLWLTAVVGHEEPEAEKDGPKALIEDINSGRTPCDRIMIVEGPDKLWVMSMGSMVFTIHLDQAGGGRHTNFVPFSENPIRHMSDLIQRRRSAPPGRPRTHRSWHRSSRRLLQPYSAAMHADRHTTLDARQNRGEHPRRITRISPAIRGRRKSEAIGQHGTSARAV
jgi:acetylornithine deacetylase/succinyl-diaminopimelate desuccinylase-like protein